MVELRTIGKRFMIKLKAMNEILCMSLITYILNWKCLETAIKEKKGTDSAMQLQIDEETAKWREILNCISDVILFLAECNLH